MCKVVTVNMGNLYYGEGRYLPPIRMGSTDIYPLVEKQCRYLPPIRMGNTDTYPFVEKQCRDLFPIRESNAVTYPQAEYLKKELINNPELILYRIDRLAAIVSSDTPLQPLILPQ